MDVGVEEGPRRKAVRLRMILAISSNSKGKGERKWFRKWTWNTGPGRGSRRVDVQRRLQLTHYPPCARCYSGVILGGSKPDEAAVATRIVYKRKGLTLQSSGIYKHWYITSVEYKIHVEATQSPAWYEGR